MNWVGGARNRLKLKHENKLQKEFFERKRQLKGNTKTAPVAKKIDKVTGRGSQDLFSLEVIMTAHKKDKKQRKADRIHTSRKSSQTNHECSEKPCRQDIQSKQLQHILPELSPARQQLPAANLAEGKCGNFCSDHLKRECIFTSQPSPRQTDEHEAMAGRQAVPTAMNDEEKLGTREATFGLALQYTQQSANNYNYLAL